MTIYVSELPKKCADCPFYKLDTYIDVYGYQTHSHECVLDGSILTNSCPLQSLADHDNQVKKEICDQQSQRIAELEEQLKNAIVPKFKVGDKVYAIIDTFAYTDVLPVEIRDNHLLYEVWDGQDTTKQHFTRIFATKEEAQARLQELKGETDVKN